MMITTLEEVQNVFKAVIDGSITRDEAERWASDRREDIDAADSQDFRNMLHFEKVLEILGFLQGIDMLGDSSGGLLYSQEDIKETYDEYFSM